MSILKHIPNAITSLNLFSGILGVIFCLGGNVYAAFIMMLAAVVFDFCDGLTARLLGVVSPLGKQLDSLADVVSFGVLPALMLMETMILHKDPAQAVSWKSWFYMVPLLLGVFSALRLAKFNIDERQTDSFLGLPTPASALLAASLCVYIEKTPESFLSVWAGTPWFLPGVALVLCALVVSELPMFSLKIHKGDSVVETWKRISILTVAVILLAAVLVWGKHWSLAILLTFIAYLLINCAFALFTKK